MSMILYHGAPNGPSLAVLAALGESGLDIECRPIDLLAGDRHCLPGVTEPVARDMGVEGEGPVLVIDGEAMTESVFIAQFLDESGANTLQPKDAYAHWQMMMWCRRIIERCAPAAAFLGCKAQAHAELAAMDEGRWSDLLAAIASEDLRARWSVVRAGDFPEAHLTDSVGKIADAVAMVEDQLADGRDWLMGELTIADFETYCWLAGMPALIPDAFADRPRVAAWLDRVRTRPSVQAALELSAKVDPQGVWAPGPEINRWG